MQNALEFFVRQGGGAHDDTVDWCRYLLFFRQLQACCSVWLKLHVECTSAAGFCAACATQLMDMLSNALFNLCTSQESDEQGLAGERIKEARRACRASNVALEPGRVVQEVFRQRPQVRLIRTDPK
jgi:hypothetical protein